MKLTGDSGTWRLGHRPALDGLRAIAVLMVVATHFDTGQFTLGGVTGVTMFFTLSGFLITTLLLEERTRTGRVSWSGFYRRRALRLLPALAVMLAVVCLLTVSGFPTDVRPGMVAAIVGYVSNWYLAATPVDGVTYWGALSHTWSLAIEEQFYFVWPLVVLAVTRWRRGVLVTAGVGAVASLVWWIVSGRTNLSTEISAYGLLVGCALAAWMSGRRTVRVPWWVPVVALASLGGLIVSGQWGAAHVATPLLTAVAIYAVVQVEVRWLTWAPMLWVGRRSYGLYLWHVPIVYVASSAKAPLWTVMVPVALALSFGVTALSWRYVEAPLLRLKDRPLRLSADDTVRARRGYEPVRRPQPEGVVARP